MNHLRSLSVLSVLVTLATLPGVTAAGILDKFQGDKQADNTPAAALSCNDPGFLGAVIGTVGKATGNDNAADLLSATMQTCLVTAALQELLTPADQHNVAVSNEKAIVTGEDQAWSNSETGVSGSAAVRTAPAKTKKKRVPILKSQVETVPPIEYIGSEYRVLTNTQMRSGPGDSFKQAGDLTQGDRVHVKARVVDEPWFMIASGGVVQGYAPVEALESTGQIGELGEAPKGEVAKPKTQVTSTCKTIDQTVTAADGTTTVETIMACQGPNGWEIV